MGGVRAAGAAGAAGGVGGCELLELLELLELWELRELQELVGSNRMIYRSCGSYGSYRSCGSCGSNRSCGSSQQYGSFGRYCPTCSLSRARTSDPIRSPEISDGSVVANVAQSHIQFLGLLDNTDLLML